MQRRFVLIGEHKGAKKAEVAHSILEASWEKAQFRKLGGNATPTFSGSSNGPP